jgi:hypothetical protein
MGSFFLYDPALSYHNGGVSDLPFRRIPATKDQYTQEEKEPFLKFSVSGMHFF